MGWKDEYRNKTVTPDEAVSIVRDGDRVVIPLTEQPLGLVSALINVSDRLDEVAVCVSTPAFDIGALLSAGLEVEVEIFLGPLAREYENHSFHLISVDAKPEIRFERLKKRARSGDSVTWDNFLAQEALEESSEDPNNQQLFLTMKKADFSIDNSGTLEDLERNIDNLLNNL